MNLRITRLGCLAVHLMPRYHGEALKQAVQRIVTLGPKDKMELAALLRANAESLPDPQIVPAEGGSR